jgi:hypothetical protein
MKRVPFLGNALPENAFPIRHVCHHCALRNVKTQDLFKDLSVPSDMGT